MHLDVASVPGSGVLTAVFYVYEELPDPFAIHFEFERGSLFLVADAETDEVEVGEVAADGRSVDVTRESPWADAHGRHCLWSWNLTNNTGHMDAVQMLFAAPPKPDVCIQLIVAGATFSAYELNAVPPREQSTQSAAPRRITFFVESSEHRDGEWHVRGEVGLGPVIRGDVFTAVHHQDDSTEEACAFTVTALSEGDMWLTATEPVKLRRGDILGGEQPS